MKDLKKEIEKLIENEDFISYEEFIFELKEEEEEVKKYLQWRVSGGKMNTETLPDGYIVTSGRQKYCSEKCQHEAGLLLQKKYKSAYNKETNQTQKKREKNSKKFKICEYCGKKFQSATANNTCSDYCRHKQSQVVNARARINRGEKTTLDIMLKEREYHRNKVRNKGGI